MKLNTYLNFDGRCEAAFNFYVQHLGAEITALMTFNDGPPEAVEHVSEDWRSKVMHATLTIDGYELMGTDGMGVGGGGCAGDEAAAVGIKGAHVVIHVDTPTEAEDFFKVLSEEGAVEMPMDRTFFARRFGMAVDRFGVPWMVLCE